MSGLHCDRDWLFQKYIVERLSTSEIGRLVHRDPKTVYCKLVEFKIPTRPRGCNLKGNDHYTRQPDFKPIGRKHSDETKKKISQAGSRPRPNLRGERNGMFGRTGSLNPRYIDGSSPYRNVVYSSNAWKLVRDQVLERDQYRCARCGFKKQGPRSLHLHHIIPWSREPERRLDPTNLVVLCRSCHIWVHSRTNVDRNYLK